MACINYGEKLKFLTKVNDCSDLAEICSVNSRVKMNVRVFEGFGLGRIVLEISSESHLFGEKQKPKVFKYFDLVDI